MTPEAPRPTPEEAATGLIAQALEIQQQGLEQEVIVHSRIFQDSPFLAVRFQLQKPADSRMEHLIDDLLKVDDKSAVLYESGKNDLEGYRYAQCVTPSRRFRGFFTLQETATRKRVRAAERSSILVSRANLTQFKNWSQFFEEVLHKTS